MADDKPLPRHGTRSRYNHRTHPCRCEKCRAVNARGQRAYRATGSTVGARRVTAGPVPVVDKRGAVVGHQHPLFS